MYLSKTHNMSRDGSVEAAESKHQIEVQTELCNATLNLQMSSVAKTGGKAIQVRDTATSSFG